MDYLAVVLLVAAVAATFVVIARSNAWQERRARAEQHSQMTLAKRTAEADVAGLGEALAELAPAVTDEPLATADYQRARTAHERATEALHAAGTPDDLASVTAGLEEGRWAMACAAARLAGEPLPSRRPPCFFNPGHGPSAETVVWQQRTVPACAADATRVESGADPYIRTVECDDRRVPYWEGGPTYAGWARGYYASWSA